MYRQSSGKKLRLLRKTVGLGAFIVVILLLTAGACGGNPPQDDPSLSVSPSSLAATVGGSAQTFTATLTNSTDTVNWSLTGAGSISATTGETTIYTPPATGGTSTDILKATAGDLEDTATINITVPTPTTITVNGKVLNFDGSAATGVNVQIDDSTGAISAAISDGTGSFSMSNIKTPYTLSVVPPAGTNAPQTWTGVNRANPTVVVNPFAGPSAFCPSPAPGALTVNFASPVTAGNAAAVAFVATGISHFELNSNVNSTAVAGATTITLPVAFDTSLCQTTVTGKVIYLETDASLNIIRTASTDATVTTGNTTTVAITQQTASTKSLKGTVTFPAGTTTATAFMVAKVGGASVAFFGIPKTVTSTTPTYEFAAPEIDGVELRSLVFAGAIGGTIVWRYSDVISTLPATANVSLPSVGATVQPSGAIGTNSTPTFSYTAVSDVNLYTTQLANVGGALTQWIGSTSTTSIKIPSLPAPARLDIGSVGTPNQFQWFISAVKVRAGGDSDTLLDGRQVKKLYLGGFFTILNPDIISGGSINATATNFTLP